MGEEAGANFDAGGAFDVGEFVVKIFRARRFSGQEMLRVVEGRGGAGSAGGGVFLGGAGKGGEGGGIGAEGAGGGADTEDFNRQGVVGADEREQLEAADDATENTVQKIEARGGREGEEKFTGVGVGAGVGHREDTSGVMAEAGGELVGEVVRNRVGFVVGVFEAGVAALQDEARDNAVPGEPGVKRLAVTRGERALGEADKIGAHERRPRGKKLRGERTAGRDELGVESVG